MRDAFTENLCQLLRQDLKDMAAGTYVPPPPHERLFIVDDESYLRAKAAKERREERADRPAIQFDWKPIETAPRDGSKIYISSNKTMFRKVWWQTARENKRGNPRRAGWANMAGLITFAPIYWSVMRIGVEGDGE